MGNHIHGAAGSLTDGICQTQQWTVVPDSDRITCLRRYLLGVAGHGRCGTHRKGDFPVAAATTKNCSILNGCRSRFSATKNHRIRTCRFPCDQRLSSSPDSRIVSPVQSSQVSPMTGFRLAQQPPRIQWRYRPGFSPGFLFSHGAVTTTAGTQTGILFVL